MMAEHETPHFATFVITCDCCGDSGIDPYMRSFDQSDVDICMPCFNDLRRQMTSPEAVKSAETLWKSQTDEHIAHMAAEKRKRDGDKGRSPRDPSLSLHEQDGPQAIIGELHSTLAKRSKK